MSVKKPPTPTSSQAPPFTCALLGYGGVSYFIRTITIIIYVKPV
jgi:hypothetical protein